MAGEWGPSPGGWRDDVRDVGNEFEFITAARDASKMDAGWAAHPARRLVDGDGEAALALFARTPGRSAQGGESLYRRRFRADQDLQFRKPRSGAITIEAHRLGLTVTGHVPIEMIITGRRAEGSDQQVSFLPR